MIIHVALTTIGILIGLLAVALGLAIAWALGVLVTTSPTLARPLWWIRARSAARRLRRST